jgi:malonyl-CoA O-methyltransferase
MQVDKDLARRRFSRAARHYNQWSKPQERMAERLMTFLSGSAATSILEIGCGTGILTEHLARTYPDATITAIDNAPGMIEECRRKWPDAPRMEFLLKDAEDLQLDREFDLIISSACFQWVGDLKKTLNGCRRILAPNGVLAFAAPANGTLGELRSSYLAAAPGKTPGHTLPDSTDYYTASLAAGLQIEAATTESHVFEFNDPKQALDFVRGIGAAKAIVGDPGGLNRTQIRALMEHYESRFAGKDGGVTCTYVTTYLKARP